MVKNFVLLALLTWVSFSFAKNPHHEGMVAKENMAEAETYKVEKAAPEQEAQRSVAGSKIKKNKNAKGDGAVVDLPSDSDSEVRYWQYSE
jgi:hypothetical protein